MKEMIIGRKQIKRREGKGKRYFSMPKDMNENYSAECLVTFTVFFKGMFICVKKFCILWVMSGKVGQRDFHGRQYQSFISFLNIRFCIF